MTSVATTENPFVGLRPFDDTPEDIRRFFGRREQTSELLASLDRYRFLAVVGSSGCGKSSLIRAGLIPALRAGFLVERRDSWQVAKAKPGDTPLRNLARALLTGDDETPAAADVDALLADIHERHAQAVLDRIERRVGARDNLLLLIDQFEEIFAFRPPEDDTDNTVRVGSVSPARAAEDARKREEAAAFVDLIVRLGRESQLPVYTVLTMRTDFLGDCDVFYGLPEAMNRGRYLVPRLTRQQLRQAIAGPARSVGTDLAPRLVDYLLNELGSRSDRLPILQHALFRAWKLWQAAGAAGRIDRDDFDTAGGLAFALSEDAREALALCDAADAQKVFRCLTDTDENNRRVRRPARISEIEAITNLSKAAILAVLDPFRAEDRCLVYFSDASEADPRVDISHESLIRRWPLLSRWVDDERRARDRLRDLVKSAREKARSEGSWLQGPRLALTRAWVEANRPNATWAERHEVTAKDFETAHRFFRDSEADAERERQRERSNKFWQGVRWIVTGVLALVLLLILVYTYFARQRSRAEAELDKEILQRANESLAAEDYDLAGLRLAKLRGTPPELESKVDRIWRHGLLHRWPSADHAPVAFRVAAFATEETQPDSRRVLVVSTEGEARVLTFEYSREPAEWVMPGDCRTAALSADGRLVAAAADDGLRVWKVGNTTAAAAEELSSTSDIRVIEFGPGPAIATADAAGQVALWRFADARWRSIDLTVDPEAPGIPGDLLGGVPGNLRFSADGRWLAASSSSAEVGLWQLHAEKAQRRVTHGHTRAVLDLAIGGDRFATVSWDGTTRLGTLPESDPIAAGAIPTAVSFSPDGSRIVTACEDKVARVYSAQDGHLVAELEGHLKAVTAATFGFGNDRVFTVSEDGTAMFFDVATRKRDTELDVLDRVVRATYSRDGVYLLTVHDQERGQEIRIWTPSRPIPTDGGTRLAGKELLELYCSRTSQKLPTDPQPER